MLKPGKPFNPHGIFQNVYTPRAVARIKEISALSKLVYGMLCAHCGRDGLVYPSQKTLAEELGSSVNGIANAIKSLEEKGLLAIARPEGTARLMHRNSSYVFLWHDLLETPSEPPKNGSRTPTEWGSGPQQSRVPTKTDILKQRSSSPDEPATRTRDSGEEGGVGVDGTTEKTGQVKETSARFQKLFLRSWKRRHGRDYPFQKKDGALLKSLHSRLKGDRALFKQILQRYFADDWHGWNGHSVGTLSANLPHWLIAPPPAPGVAQENTPDYDSVISNQTGRSLSQDDLRNLTEDE